MNPELLSLAVGVIFWIAAIALFVAWLISRAAARFRASVDDDGCECADWGGEHLHNGTGQ